MRAKARFLSVLAFVAACDPGYANGRGGNARAATADSVVLERKACFGPCPVYRLSVAKSGRVAYLSRAPGDEQRTITDSIAPMTAVRLLTDAVKAGIYLLPDSIYADRSLCPTSATDFPWYVVTVFDPKGAKGVVDYAGCFQQMGAKPGDWSIVPVLKPLRAYENAIDSVAGSDRWVRPSGALTRRPNDR